MKFIFHLGTYKTGTSSLQNFLFENRAILAGRGLCYPKTGLVGKPALGYQHRRIIEAINREGRSDILREVMDEAAGLGCQTVFLSCEAWSHPANFSALQIAVHALRSFGVSQFDALVTLRNVVDYQVSHYREFTLNQRNAVPYARYAAARQPWVDYRLLLQNFRTLFQGDLHVLDYHQVADSRVDVLRALGLEALTAGCDLGHRANVKSTGALEIEAARIANEFGLQASDGLAAHSRLLLDKPSLAQAQWTERVAGDVTLFDAAYIEAFRDLSGWDAQNAEALFAIAPLSGRNVTDATEQLHAYLKPHTPGLLQRGLRKVFKKRR